MAAAHAGGDSPILLCVPPQLTVPALATPKPRWMQRRGSAQGLPQPGDSPVSPPPHSPSAPPEAFSDVLPAHGGHLCPHQGRCPRGCQHRDDAAHEGRRCPMMPAPTSSCPRGRTRLLLPPTFSLIRSPEDSKAAADGQNISKTAGTNDLYEETRNSRCRGVSQPADVYLPGLGSLRAVQG